MTVPRLTWKLKSVSGSSARARKPNSVELTTSATHATPSQFLTFSFIKCFSNATRARELHRFGHLPELEEQRAIRFRERDGTKDPPPIKVRACGGSGRINKTTCWSR